MGTKYASMNPQDARAASSLWEGPGVITGFKFTKEPPDNYEAQGNPIFAVVSILADGDAPEDERKQQQSYSLGAKAGDEFTISEDGYGLIPSTDDVTSVRAGSKFHILLASLATEGVSAALLGDGDMSKLIGLHGQFKRVNDPERTFADDGRKKKETKFKPQTLVLVKLLAMPGEKTATTTSSTKATTTPAADSGDFDLDSATMDVLQTVLKAAKNNEIQRAQVTLAVNKAVGQHPQRLNIAKRAAAEDFLTSLAELGVVTYDPAAKPQVIKLAA